MQIRSGSMMLAVALGLTGLAQVLPGQSGQAVRAMQSAACAGTNLGSEVAVHSLRSKIPALSLCDGRVLTGNAARLGQAEALALAAGDLDEDGVPDLVSGFRSGKGGVITVHRGNVQALWPYGAALRNAPPAAFLPNARSFAVPEAAEMVAVGDFDADGHWDVVTAQRGSNALYFLRGDGRGGFAAAKRIGLAGTVTAMIAGEINRRDGLTDLAVAVNSGDGPRVLVFESPRGALQGNPEEFRLPEPASALALGRFNGGGMNDLVVAAGSQIVMIQGRDRKLSVGEAERGTVPAARVTQFELPFVIQSIAAGDFTGTGPGIAAVGEDGKVHFLEHSLAQSELAGSALSEASFNPTMQVAGRNGRRTALAGTLTPGKKAKLAALRESLNAVDAPEWIERSSVALPAGFTLTSGQLTAAHVTGATEEDLIVPDSGNNQVHVLSTVTGGPKSLSSPLVGKAGTPMRLLASLEAHSAPAAVLPMRLNQHGLSGLVMLQAGQAGPTLMPQAAANIFTVTNTRDAVILNGIVKTGPDGSLRKAMADAAGATGPSDIVFNIPTSDPGYNAQTKTFLIQPLSESVPGAFDNFALPPINATVTIDGYTQPGASPNTLATGDNAKILIQIDGAKATTPGGAGLVPFDDVGSVYRGLAFTGWTNGAVSNGTESGAEGIEANGVGDFIEGNFFGTDPTGTVAAANRIGVFADNGPVFGSAPGNIIGGTTPQARNLLSGNQIGGVLFLAIAYEARLEGNFVGTDITGTKQLANNGDGTGLNGPTITIGGTLPGATNVISGNFTNVDINDLTNIGYASNSVVQGNLIGTDPTGTKAVNNSVSKGVSILNNPQKMLIGGTTPAARNVIAGNNYGVYIFDNSFYNTVQGNFIGVDISGAKALANTAGGFISGATGAGKIFAGDTTIGGSVAGAGNVISGNGSDGIQISGTSNGPNNSAQTLQGNTIQGNLIGTDVSGKTAIANGGNGIALIASATNNLIGGSQQGAGNLIANNAVNGVLIDPGTANPGEGFGNNTIGNTILSNAAAGVHVNSGTTNRISRNSIFGNGALGIDLGTAGPNSNTHCNATNTGANDSQNAPVLTAGTGSAFLTATATDPNGNTSEFSNAVKATANGNTLTLLGTFDSLPSTTFSIEFFSSTAADPSGFGQGQTYLGTTTVTTDASCKVIVNNPVDTTGADVAVTLTDNPFVFLVGPDAGQVAYTSTVSNNGPATAHNVVFTDVLPDGLEISSGYCNVAACQSPVISTLGTCSVSGKTITCDLGTMAPGTDATITIPVQVTTSASITNTVTAQATETDPIPANNTASTTIGTRYPFPFIDHLDPASALTNDPNGVLMTVYGTGLISSSQVTFNGTTVPIQDIVDNQVCGGSFSPFFCTGLRVKVPTSLLTTAGTVNVIVTDPDPGPGGGPNSATAATFTIASSCTYTTSSTFFGNVGADGSGLIADAVSVNSNVQSCPWTATSNVPWAVILDHPKGNGYGSADVNIAANTGAAARTGTITLAGQTISFTQDGGSTCPDTLSAATAISPVGGGSGSVQVTTGSGCAYFVTSYAPWITIPKSSGLLVGSATASYVVAPNPGGPRTGEVVVGGSVLTINQDAASCYFSLDSTSTTAAASGATGSLAVTASAPGCAWTATSSDTAHLKVTSGASGTGNGTVKYSVPVNLDGPQAPTITVGNATASAVFTVNQASAFTCTFTITPTPLHVTANGTSNFFTLTASFSFCKWTAYSSDPSVISIPNSSGMGTSAVYYTVAQNQGAARTVTIVAGCQTFTVNQDGTPVSNPVPTIATLQPTGLQTGSGAFTLTVNGTNFVNGSIVNFNGTARATTFVSATQLTAAILASDVASVGTPAVTVFNPTPGGGTSNAATFNVTQANNPVPAITTLQPTGVTAGSGAFTLTVNGSNFISGSIVKFNGTARATTFVSATQLTAAILASDVASVGTPAVTVFNPTPGGGTSNAATFNVTQANNPVPAITTLQPTGVTAGSGAFTLTVNGSNFIAGSVVKFNGTARATTFVSANQLTAAILASDVASVGTPAVTVFNPTPGGGTSNAVTFNVTQANNPVPAITTLQPTGVIAGSGAFTLTVNGSNFIAGSVVKFNGTARAITFVSATQLTAAVLASDVAAAGSASVTVFNPAPGGGTSNSVAFAVNNPAPTVTSLQPASATAGTAAFTLTINGTGFNASSVATFNGNAKPTTFVNSTQLTAAISAADVATAGVVPVAVVNPAPGGGTSAPANFTINTPGAPQVSLLPASLAFPATNVGSTSVALTITLTNTGNASLTLNGISLSGVNPADFAQTNNCSSTVAAGASCSISVTFTPLSAASFAANVSVADNATGSPQTVPLSGTGTTPVAPVVSLTPASLSFSAVTGTTTAAQTATLKNTGNATLTISGITLTGANAADFAQTNACGSSLEAGASCAISITFTPASTASFTANLSVADNAAGSPHSVSLSGTGTPPPSFTVTSSTTPQTVTAGGAAQYTIAVTAQNGSFGNPVTLSATGLPTGATATFVPATVTPGNGAQSSTLTIQTAAAMAAAADRVANLKFMAFAFPLLGFGFAVKRIRRRWATLLILLIASLGALTAMTGCGGGFALPGSKGTTYNVTVTGTSGGQQQSTTVQLTVQ